MGKDPIHIYYIYIYIQFYTYLVGGLEHEFYDFPYIGNGIIPTDELIFLQRGRYTTNQICMELCTICT